MILATFQEDYGLFTIWCWITCKDLSFDYFFFVFDKSLPQKKGQNKTRKSCYREVVLWSNSRYAWNICQHTSDHSKPRLECNPWWNLYELLSVVVCRWTTVRCMDKETCRYLLRLTYRFIDRQFCYQIALGYSLQKRTHLYQYVSFDIQTNLPMTLNHWLTVTLM